MNKNLVSLIVPIYNSQQYIERTILCMITQSYKNIEILLINDGSTDNSRRICEIYCKKDDRIKLINTKHRGVSNARNIGLSNAHGYYVEFVDSDDCVDQDTVKRFVDILTASGCAMAVGGYKKHSGEVVKYLNKIWNRNDDIQNQYIISNNILGVLWNKMFVREKINKGFIENLNLCEDSIFCINYYLSNPNIVTFSQSGYLYNDMNNDSLTKQFHIQSLLGMEEYRKKNYQILIQSKMKCGQYYFEEADRIYFYGVYSYILENIVLENITIRAKIGKLKSIVYDSNLQHVVENLKVNSFKEKLYRDSIKWKQPEVLLLFLYLRRYLLKK